MQIFKLISLFLLIAIILFSCADEFYTAQRQYSIKALQEISPKGLSFNDNVGRNWWTGFYYERNVLIHAVPTYQFVTIDIIFID